MHVKLHIGTDLAKKQEMLKNMPKLVVTQTKRLQHKKLENFENFAKLWKLHMYVKFANYVGEGYRQYYQCRLTLIIKPLAVLYGSNCR